MALQDQTLANTAAKMSLEAKRRRRNTQAALAAMQPGIRRRGELPVTLGGLGSLLLGVQGEHPGARPVGPYLESTPEPVTPPSAREMPPWASGASQFAATQLLRALSDRGRNRDRVPSWQMPHPMPATQGERDVLGMLPVAGDVEDVRYLAEGVREGDPAKMLMGGAATALPFVPASLLHTVYHGSPHIFDAFSLSKIGTGEGAQAYGHGLYFAEEPSVAESYRSVGGLDTAEKKLEAVRGLRASTTDEDKARILDRMIGGNYLRKIQIDDFASEQRMLGRPDLAEWIETDVMQAAYSPTALYTVDIPDEAVGRMLDWDKPLSEQPESVREGLKKMDLTAVHPDYQQAIRQRLDSSTSDGGELYNLLAGPGLGSQEAATEILHQVGIPGIRYFDAMSRGAEEGTRNLVLFDESLATILERK